MRCCRNPERPRNRAADASSRLHVRDAIAFPKSATGADPLTGAPAEAEEQSLRDLHIVSTAPKPEA